MPRRWAVLFLVLVPIALGGPVAARTARKPEKKLTAREPRWSDYAAWLTLIEAICSLELDSWGPNDSNSTLGLRRI